MTTASGQTEKLSCSNRHFLRAVALVLAVAVLALTAGCSSEPTVTSHDPNPAAVPLESPLQEGQPGPDSTFVAATVQPTAPPSPAVNLRPETPEGWDAPLLIARNAGARRSTQPNPDERVYISWAVSNSGPTDVAARFFIDLLLDGVPVERWTSQALELDGSLALEDWTGLQGRAGLTPGNHTLRLVVDSTDLIAEEDEGDNTYAIQFTWTGSRGPEDRPAATPSRLPNLGPFTPRGWDDPIRLEQAPSGALRLQVAYDNSGLSSTGRFFQTHLYMDGILVAKYSERGLLAQQRVVAPLWDGLTKVVYLKPGMHTLTLVVDPTGRITEADEVDNRATVEFEWLPGLGVFSDSARTVPRASPARVEPFTPPGWDAPIVATNTPGELETPAMLLTSRPVYVHWALRNNGDTDLNEPFSVDVYVDDVLAKSWARPGLAGGDIDFTVGWPLADGSDLTAGPHVIELFTRPTGPETEGQGGTLLSTRRILLGEEHPSQQALRTYTPEQINRRLARLNRLLSDSSAVGRQGSAVLIDDVMAVADAVYYSLNQRSLLDEPLALHLLTGDEYGQWVDIECQDTLSRLPVNAREPYQRNCERLEGFSGFTTYWRGQHRIVMRADRPPVQILATLAHELGHFRQSMHNPSLGALPPYLDLLALQEAQAYAYQIYFLKVMESLTGQDLMLYPKLKGYDLFVEERIDALVEDINTSEHARGRLLLWLAVLTDPNLREIRSVLLAQRTLNAQAGLDLFSYLIRLQPQDVTPFIDQRMGGLRTQVPAIKALAAARLIAGLPYWNEGSPFLREVGLLLP